MAPLASSRGAVLRSNDLGDQVTRPVVPEHMIGRPDLLSRLSDVVSAHRVTTVTAPAGFGKTSLLTSWAAETDARVGWISLTRADQHPEHLRRVLVGALDQLVLDGTGDPDPGPADRSGLREPPERAAVLVIDDAQFADTDAASKVLAELIGRRDLDLKFVISTRRDLDLGLSRLLASGELGQLNSSALALTDEEIRQAASALGRSLDAVEAAHLGQVTAGWPVAVRLALISEGRARTPAPAWEESFPQLVDYLVENVLGQLPAPLSDFVAQACTCDRLTSDLAVGLTGNPRAAEALEECVARGLPLECTYSPGRDPIYRWHPVMVQAGRAVLVRRDPALARSLHRRAAELLAVAAPYEAATHALAAKEQGLAAELIKSQWLAAVLRGDSELVNELCVGLGAPWAEDPEILTIRALCQRNVGEDATASRLARRASIASRSLVGPQLESYEVTGRLARLYLADEEHELGAACDAIDEHLVQRVDLDGALYACALLLLGWSRLRLRHGPAAVAVLREASLRCRAEGLDDLSDRAWAHYAFMLAFCGEFDAAREAIAVGQAPASADWRRSDGAVESVTLGWILFWSGHPQEAIAPLREAAARGGALTSHAPLARVWLSYSALALGDPRLVAEAESLLDDVPDSTVQGVPWRVYKLIARAGGALLHDDPVRAGTLLDEMAAIPAFIPAARVLAAELYWDCGRVAEARGQAQGMLENTPGYVRVGAMTVTALCLRHDGETEAAHHLLEQALKLGAELGVDRPFIRPGQQLTELLLEHSARGTDQELLLAELIAQRQSKAQAPGTTFSAREREILGYLCTTMTAEEIRQRLFISQNTLKTHLRSIYRKLGVDNRRDAARLSRGSWPPERTG